MITILIIIVVLLLFFFALIVGAEMNNPAGSKWSEFAQYLSIITIPFLMILYGVYYIYARIHKFFRKDI